MSKRKTSGTDDKNTPQSTTTTKIRCGYCGGTGLVDGRRCVICLGAGSYIPVEAEERSREWLDTHKRGQGK